MKHTFTDPDLIELDRIWPIGQMLEMPEEGSIVVAGAYEGRYIAYLHEMFPKVIITGYEPQKNAFTKLSERFFGQEYIEVKNYGLATSERRAEIGFSNTDGASIVSPHGDVADVSMYDAVSVLQSFAPIDLFLMNMEGYEWALIPYLLDEMMHHRIRTFAIQFHTEYVSHERAQRVISYLSEYYNNTFNCPGWTYWERK